MNLFCHRRNLAKLESNEKYIKTKVYDNDSCQAKVFEIACGNSELCSDRLAEIVIA